MHQRRSQEERSADTRERIIQSAICEIARAGYASVTTNDIADKAGVSRGALQHQFHSRYDLIAAVVDRVMSDIVAKLRVTDIKRADLPTRVKRVLASYRASFSSPTYKAALSIYLSTSSDTQLKLRVEKHLRSIHREADKAWKELFWDVELGEDRLLSIRRVVVASTRGYAILGFGETSSHWTEDMETLTAFVISHFEKPETSNLLAGRHH